LIAPARGNPRQKNYRIFNLLREVIHKLLTAGVTERGQFRVKKNIKIFFALGALFHIPGKRF
jgi:hypothetical protein